MLNADVMALTSDMTCNRKNVGFRKRCSSPSHKNASPCLSIVAVVVVVVVEVVVVVVVAFGKRSTT